MRFVRVRKAAREHPVIYQRGAHVAVGGGTLPTVVDLQQLAAHTVDQLRELVDRELDRALADLVAERLAARNGNGAIDLTAEMISEREGRD